MTDYLFLDLETTGLNHKSCRIIEIAAVLTKEDLKPYTQWGAIIYQNPHVGWEGVAEEMHKRSGLYELVKKGEDEREAQRIMSEWLSTHLKDRKANLGGNSVHFDRGFIAEQWPSIMPFLTHRHLDVSSFKVYCEGRGVKRFTDNKPAHRALADVRNSLAEFEYYRQEMKKLD